MSYCTKISLGNGERLDLFTPSVFRLRMPKLHTEEIPEIYDIPFAVGHTEDWAEVPYTLQEEGAFYTVITDEIAIYVRKQAHDRMTMLLVKDFGATGFTTSDTFMTNADVPTLAMAGLIENPVNPFTGNPINSSFKEEKNILLLK